jgi:hypothetical protein
MTSSKRIGAVVVLCLAVGTSAFAQHVRTAWDRSADFAAFHTYAWQPSPQPAKGDWNQAIIDAIDKQLQAKGLTKVDTDPDVAVVYSRSIDKESTQGLSGGYVIPPDGDVGGPGIPAIARSWEEGTLVVELGNPKTKQVLWRASASKTLSDNNNKNLKSLDKAVAKLFKDYPPKGTK